MTTTPDYAELIERLEGHFRFAPAEVRSSTFDLLDEAAAALRTLLESNAALERERTNLKAENARLRERQAEADRVIDMVEEDPALARSLARSYRDKGDA